MKLDAFKIFRMAIAEQDEDAIVDFVNEYCKYSGKCKVDKVEISCYNATDYSLLQGLFNNPSIWVYSSLWESYIAHISEEIDIDWYNDMIPYDGYKRNMFEEFIEDEYEVINLPSDKEKLLNDWYEYQDNNDDYE